MRLVIASLEDIRGNFDIRPFSIIIKHSQSMINCPHSTLAIAGLIIYDYDIYRHQGGEQSC